MTVRLISMAITRFTHSKPGFPGATNRRGKLWPWEKGSPPTRVTSSYFLTSSDENRCQ